MNTPIPLWTPFTPLIDESQQNNHIEFEPLNLNEVVKAVYELFEMAAKYKRVKLIVEENDIAADFVIEGNRADVTHMVTQMVKNAMAQTLEGYIKIRLSQLKNRILVEVEDSGIGIHPDEKIAMVDVMYRGRQCHITHVQDPKTSMAQMANQLHSHHAHLEFSIERGKGMKRRLHLPIQQATMNASKASKSEPALVY